MKSGIYKITNVVNSKFYIGSSVNIDNRWKSHVHRLQQDKHHSRHLQSAWNKYGKSSFKLEILKEVEPALLMQEEQFLLDMLKPWSRDVGYNCSPSADSSRGIKRKPVTPRTRLKMSAAQRERKITWGDAISRSKRGKPQTTANPNRRRLVGKHPVTLELLRFPSAHDAAKYLGNPKAYSNIHSVCKGLKKSYKGWTFYYVKP